MALEPERPIGLGGGLEAIPPPGRWQRLLWRRGPWLALAAGLITLVTVLALTDPLPRVDRLLQDHAFASLTQAPSDKIVIVSIDEESLAAVGRWPWRRALHAELLRRIAVQSPRCIGFDVLLTEPQVDPPQDDAVLAEAIRDSGCVVLPMALPTTLPGRDLQVPHDHLSAPLLPELPLAAAATAIGQAHLLIDNDGVARNVHLYGSSEGQTWPHFTVALYDAAEAYASDMATALSPQTKVAPWRRNDDAEPIIFTNRKLRYQTVSYIDVLRGEVPTHLFSGRFVLVGTTAMGLGDAYGTPDDSNRLMPGVEIYANILQGLLNDRHVRLAETWEDLLFNLTPLVVALFGLLWLRPIGVVGLIAALLAMQMGIHIARPWIGMQFAPSSSFIGLLLVYPLWSLLRLSAAIRYLRWGTRQLSADFGGLGQVKPHHPSTGDFLDRQMAATAAAAQHMRDLHRLVRDGIDHMPDATLLLDRRGRVRVASRSAQRHWETDADGLTGRDTHELLADVTQRDTKAPMVPPGALLGVPRPIAGEAEDARQRSLLMRCVPFFNAAGEHVGWMLSLVNITEMRRAQGQRDEALRFISHDIREPSASILTILELARARPEAHPPQAVFGRIARHAQTGLELADGFVNLARAEAQVFRAEQLDLLELMQQAIDAAWALASKREVRMVLSHEMETALCFADRSLLMRAFGNVLSNALKYSPPGFDLRCSVSDRGEHWAVGIQDHGPGIPIELQSQLFRPFHRLHRESHPEVHGIGLGLLLVRTVVQRHGGSIEIDSAVDAGCTVTLVLPKSKEAEPAAPAAVHSE